ncbi:MAG: sigma-70 family RNA polymerase sigma factor [Methylophilus sp.]|uniref:sigma-70 family RNA polymerase sigma factor n=1 Tax=Methylophilus sp. TaxID=29541 RepID=UPI003F9F9DE6
MITLMPTVDAPPQHQVHTLYQSHHAWLVSWLKRRLGCIHHANDLAHDTFLRLITKSLNVPHLDEPRAFLSTIAHGLMVDQFRHKAVEQAYLQTIMHLPAAMAPSPEEQLAMLETLWQLDQLLNGLKPVVRTVFLLSKLEGLTYIEIAETMKVSLRTVEAHMAVALRHVLLTRTSA